MNRSVVRAFVVGAFVIPEMSCYAFVHTMRVLHSSVVLTLYWAPRFHIVVTVLSQLSSRSEPPKLAYPLATIFQALYVLILRGVGLEAHNSIALELAEGILEDLRFSTCLRGLSVSQGAETMKSALRLLAATAAASVDLARGLLKLLNFENQEMIQCSRRRNTADACDVRTCFLNLVGVFVFKENNALLRELVSKKGVFWLVLSESYIDKYSNVILILQMLRKIVDNSTISKTQKVNLFNKNALKQLLYLFSWRGEAVKISDALSRDQLDNTHPHLSSIRSTLYELLLILHTSTRFGLVFAGRNREVDTLANGLIFSALTSPPMEAAYADPLRSQLVVESMCASPDVIRPYLDHVAPFLQPRASSSNWFSMMELVSTVFKACKVHLVSWFMRALDQWPNPEQISKVIVDSCFLSPKLVEPLGNALHFEEDSDVVVKADQLMTLLRANILILLTWLSTNERFSTPTGTPEKDQLIQQIRQLIRISGNSHALILDIRKLLKYFLIPEESDGEQLSDKVLRSLQMLPEILETCISQYFDVYTVHRCLARAVYLARIHSIKGFKAKRVLKLVLSQPSFTTVLNGKDSLSDCVEESNRSGPASYEEQFFLRGDAMTSEPSLPNKANLDQFLRAFYSRNAVAFAVAGLSSYSKHLRSMSRTVIAKYRGLLGSWQSTRTQANKKGASGTTFQLFPERVQIMFILDTLRNSLASGGGRAIGGNGRRKWMFSSALDTGGRLTRVHANFFIRSLQLLGKPENHLYQSVWNCFLSKPALDLNEVPDFLRTFFSTSTQYRMERQWITRLCAESVGDTADYLVMEKSRVFKHCLNAYSSTSSEASFQLNVLKLIASATKQPRLVHALIRFHALPLWLWRHMLVPCPVSHAAQFRTIIDNMSKVICSGSKESPASQLLPLLTEEFEKVHGVATMNSKQNGVV
ncbi:nucleolar pre-ribosomal-associated protein 1 [Clonorchis sinensis]|uniref:Nucleolar pre-ribosomal-associated protein 1 n=1 Tax=Clonorchis sinensis TaxID=79923 RepID=H2KUQ2_CLOSI|nr:nucleolar pre-ribosomal-associated protein 1 [Clonorchis sinensis]